MRDDSDHRRFHGPQVRLRTISRRFCKRTLTSLNRYKGNQLAVLECAQWPMKAHYMQEIAREFGFSETVFLHRPGNGEPPRIRIFTPVNEMDFAGHPVIGTGHVLFRFLLPRLSTSGELDSSTMEIETNAGSVAITYNRDDGTVSAQVPHNLHLNSRAAPKEVISATQPGLASRNASEVMATTYPVLSVVKGVTYVLVDFTSLPDLFGSLRAGNSPVVDLDNGWAPSFVGTMYYRLLNSTTRQGMKTIGLRVRMMAIGLEDPACGSGCCALGAFLALECGAPNGRYRFDCDQGSEIGRDSTVIVEVVLDGEGTGVENVVLSGQASLVTRGEITLPES